MMQVKISDLLDSMDALDVGLTEQQGVSAERIKEMTMMRLHTEQNHTKHHGKRAATLILAACLTLALAVSAYAAVRVIMHKAQFGNQTEISFLPGDEGYIRLGNRYPQSIPAGYELDFVSDATFGSQRITYKNEAGNQIAFICQAADSHNDYSIQNVRSEEQVEISGSKGILYTCRDYRIVFWTDDAAGIGCSLDTDDASVDLVAMAESVAPSDEALVPTYASHYDEALAELGDHDITLIPEGYESDGFTASPTSQGGGWYGYVHRHYVDKAANKHLSFSYESFRLEDGVEETAENVLALYGNGEAVSVSGFDGVTSASGDTDVVRWVDVDNHIVYILSADGIAMADLVQIARSVR